MATYAQIKARIADSLDDTTGEYTTQIAAAVLTAIRYCERDTFYFNETRDITFSTVNAQQWYGTADNANIPTLVQIQAAYKEDAGGQRTQLMWETPEAVELLSDSNAASGEPYCYTYFGKRIRLYPVPGTTVYTIRLQLGPYRLATLSADGDTNAWTEDAQDMIVARAKYILYMDTLKDPALAVASLNDYKDQHAALMAETSKRNGSGRIRATCF